MKFRPVFALVALLIAAPARAQLGQANTIATINDGGQTLTSSVGGNQQQQNVAHSMLITAVIGAVSGSTPTLSIQMQFSNGDGNWLNFGAASGNITASNSFVCLFVGQSAAPTNGCTQSVAIGANAPRFWRLAYTIGGGSPSFQISTVFVQYYQ